MVDIIDDFYFTKESHFNFYNHDMNKENLR